MRAWLEINLDAVSRNFEIISERVGAGRGVFAVVKADAYGHGLAPICRLLDSKGVAGFAVISLDEARAVRLVSDRQVLIMGYLTEAEIEEAIASGFSLSLYDLELAELYQSIALKVGRPAYVHLKVESGLNRLGMQPEEAAELLGNLSRYSELHIEAVYTHLSTSSDREEDLRQLERFRRLNAMLQRVQPHPLLHMANSHALAHFPEGYFDFVRVGLALYGVEDVLPGLEPSLQCKTVVMQRKRLAKGEGVSYNKLFRAPRDMEIAVIAIGYAEGLSQALTGKMSVLVGGRKTPVLGQICMNLSVIDVTGIPARRGDEVVVIGSARGEDGQEERILVTEMAKAAGLRHHEIITRLGKSLPKVYCQAAVPVGV
jgi:alanine racemase